jgi:hypothetical protein
MPIISFEKTKRYDSVSICESLNVDNTTYFDNLFLAIHEPNPFNRFLKLYHLLELQFDMHTAYAIKKLLENGNKEKEISAMLKEYAKEDIRRFQSLIIERCKDLVALVPLLNAVEPLKNKAIAIFYDYGKESNPLAARTTFEKILETEGKFSEDSSTPILGNINYSTMIPKLCAYWLYRVRNSIAHNKFGEYIMGADDEEFIVDFAEPLLKGVIMQCFKV